MKCLLAQSLTNIGTFFPSSFLEATSGLRIAHCCSSRLPLSMAINWPQQHQNFWEDWESNPGQLGPEAKNLNFICFLLSCLCVIKLEINLRFFFSRRFPRRLWGPGPSQARPVRRRDHAGHSQVGEPGCVRVGHLHHRLRPLIPHFNLSRIWSKFF